MNILAIETSCDETGLALIKIKTRGKKQDTRSKDQIKVLANLLYSQVAEHAKYGGVVPNIAKREHGRMLPILWDEVKKLMKLKAISSVDRIAVTAGPGLSPCLWRGIEFAKKLSAELEVPLYGINHLKGHFYTPWAPSTFNVEGVRKEASGVLPSYPILALIVSGGHTELVLSPERGMFTILGETLDDAAGEAFDKVARLLGLGFPGGPEISRVAKDGDPAAYDLPRPMIDSKDLNFSFAGLKTAVMYLVKGIPKGRKSLGNARDKTLDLADAKTVAHVAASFQQAAVDVLVAKTIRAAKKYRPKTLILGGGVAANTLLREELKWSVLTNLPTCSLVLPDLKLTGDNALMIALATWQEHDLLRPNHDLRARPNWRIDET